jgi:rod shape-determining protein MreD
MKYVIYLIAIIILLGLNIGLFNNLQIYGQAPNLLLLLVINLAVDKDDLTFFFIAFAAGLFLDAFSANFFGGWTLSFLVLALMLNFLSSRLLVLELNWKSLSLLVCGSWVLVNFCLWLYGFICYKAGLTPGYTGLKIFYLNFLPGLAYNWLLIYPIYLLTNFLKSTVRNFTIRSRGIVR